jgi:DNA-3-methyladenine glycosylase II
MQCYQSHDDLETAIAHLLRIEPRFGLVHQQHGTPSLRASDGGIEGLLMIVTEQFLSLSAAAAIWNRLFQAIQPFTAEAVLATNHATLKSLGLSDAKVRTFHAVARATATGELDFTALATLDNDVIHRILCKMPGIGPWTTDIYLLSALQRTDAWPVGDLALQVSAHHLLGLGERPSHKVMLEMAEPWRPHRAAAARLLWAHYRGLKGLMQA